MKAIWEGIAPSTSSHEGGVTSSVDDVLKNPSREGIAPGTASEEGSATAVDDELKNPSWEGIAPGTASEEGRTTPIEPDRIASTASQEASAAGSENPEVPSSQQVTVGEGSIQDDNSQAPSEGGQGQPDDDNGTSTRKKRRTHRGLRNSQKKALERERANAEQGTGVADAEDANAGQEIDENAESAQNDPPESSGKKKRRRKARSQRATRSPSSDGGLPQEE